MGSIDEKRDSSHANTGRPFSSHFLPLGEVLVNHTEETVFTH
jgi:hypothetical protein